MRPGDLHELALELVAREQDEEREEEHHQHLPEEAITLRPPFSSRSFT